MDGIIIINKPRNYTSRDIVNIIGKKFNTKKVGHTGTLDPIAEGVLIITLNKCTKLSDILTSETKKYIATLKFGELTDTLDITGNVIKTSDKIPTKEEILNCLKTFPKEYDQEVPIYSAVKVNGKKLYEYARNGISVSLPKREINIYDIELLGDIDILDNHQEFSFRVRVSKGTYIRSLIRDIGIKLGTCAVMKELTRTKQGKFCIENAYAIEEIKNDNYELLNISDVVDIPMVTVSDELLFKIKNGMVLDKFFDDEKVLILDNLGNEIGIYKVYDKDNSKVKPDKIF